MYALNYKWLHFIVCNLIIDRPLKTLLPAAINLPSPYLSNNRAELPCRAGPPPKQMSWHVVSFNRTEAGWLVPSKLIGWGALRPPVKPSPASRPTHAAKGRRWMVMDFYVHGSLICPNKSCQWTWTVSQPLNPIFPTGWRSHGQAVLCFTCLIRHGWLTLLTMLGLHGSRGPCIVIRQGWRINAPGKLKLRPSFWSAREHVRGLEKITERPREKILWCSWIITEKAATLVRHVNWAVGVSCNEVW